MSSKYAAITRAIVAISSKTCPKSPPCIGALPLYTPFMIGFRSLQSVMALGFICSSSVPCQIKAPFADAVAEEIATRDMLEAYGGGTLVGSVLYREPNLSPELLLARHTFIAGSPVDDNTISSALRALKLASMRTAATLQQPH